MIEFTQAKSGDIAFTCGMNMLHSTSLCSRKGERNCPHDCPCELPKPGLQGQQEPVRDRRSERNERISEEHRRSLGGASSEPSRIRAPISRASQSLPRLATDRDVKPFTLPSVNATAPRFAGDSLALPVVRWRRIGTVALSRRAGAADLEGGGWRAARSTGRLTRRPLHYDLAAAERQAASAPTVGGWRRAPAADRYDRRARNSRLVTRSGSSS